MAGRPRKTTTATTAATTSVATLPMAVAGGDVLTPKLQHALILNRYFCKQLGVDRFTDLQSKLHNVNAGTDDDGLTFWYHTLHQVSGLTLAGGAAKLAEYDRRITSYVQRLNQTRSAPRIVLTYYQWLSLIFTEMFLDRLFNDGAKLLSELNAAVAKLNAGEAYADLQRAYTGRNAWQYPAYNSEADLRKIAFWMATGSGKTILMHVHLWQWYYYALPTAQNGGVLLITPNESLSRQHIDEFRKSGIVATRYEDANAGGLLASASGTAPVIVLEITKLTDKKRGSGQSVSVAEFEAFGLVLVDEGHRGASGDEWRKLRGAVGKNALTLEYSATFGQIVNGATGNTKVPQLYGPEKTVSKKAMLLSEYAAAILFDFSYPHFYADGYGKDYVILNADADDTNDTSDWILLANLLSYYEQSIAYAADPNALRAYNIERPLWILVGNSVTGGKASREEEVTLSDVQTVVGFFARFLAERALWEARIQAALEGDHALKDGNGRDLLAHRFAYLRSIGRSATALWSDIVQTVFHGSPGDTLRAVEIKSASGEIALRAGFMHAPFGVINIGDVAGLKTKFEEQGIAVEDDAVGGGLFAAINHPESETNILVGSRKFMEGWDSFRVASMGLLNIGQGEGSQIIQLFGRGVRLRGKNFSLKRSDFLRGETALPPAELRLLETLNVFGVRASYMAKFRESLQNEGITTDVEEIEIPIRIAEPFLHRGLQVLRLNGSFAETVSLAVEPAIKVNIDLRPRIESASGGLGDYVAEDASGTEQSSLLRRFAPLFDWNRITLHCMNFRSEKGLLNLAFDTAMLQAVLQSATINIQSLPGHFLPDKFTGLARMENTVVTVLTKYMATFHERKRKEWETKNLHLETLTADDKNVSFGKYIVKVSTEKPQIAQQITQIVAEAKSLYERELTEKDGLPTTYIPEHLYQPLLCGWDSVENIKPTGLEPSEIAFIDDLREYLATHPERMQNRELFLLRNQVTYGVVFYDEAGVGFFPDFLLWLVEADGTQTLCFVDPHGIGREPLTGAKVQLFRRLKEEIAPRLQRQNTGSIVNLDAFILAPTHINDKSIPIIVDNTPEVLATNHILFQNEAPNQPSKTYIEAMFNMLDAP